ncbi:MAG: SNF2 helicase associated domain-containing protein [Legionellales bacterium]|nr:SNF2 helicase associated domain-containing protein [Legionellales bacterium]
MIESDIFKKLQFTQAGKQKENRWQKKLDAIEKFSKLVAQIEISSLDSKIPSSMGDVEFNQRLQFELEFESVLSEQQDLPTTSCVLKIYELVTNTSLHRINSRAALDVLMHQRELSEPEINWLQALKPYALTHSENDFKIVLPPAMEVKLLKALCAEKRLIYFDPEPKIYHWPANPYPLLFIPQLEISELGAKLWGTCVDSEGCVIDLWDIQQVTLGGVAKSNHQLFEYSPSAYPLIETLLSGGAIQSPENELEDFIDQLLRIVDYHVLEWPSNVRLELVKVPLRPVFYVKTKENKNGMTKTSIESFVWFRAENYEYPAHIHKDLKAPERPKVFQLTVQKNSENYTVALLIPDSALEHQYLQEIAACSELIWNEFRRSFTIKLHQATTLFYFLLNRGWEVWAENLQIKILQEIDVQLTTELNWFELDVTTGTPAIKISAWQLIHMLKKKRMFIQLSDGSLGILPERWYQEFERLFALRNPQTDDNEDSLRFSTAHAFHFAQLAENAKGSSDLNFKGDAEFEKIRQEILNIQGLKPLPAPPTFQVNLRSYQEMGLSWLDFLGRAHLGGCLADDMGLGKTVQVLAYLDFKRFNAAKGERFRTLLVCPRSLLGNWLQEAKKCAPRLKTAILTPAKISQLDDIVEEQDLLIVSYGMVRHHLTALQKIKFDLLALDEAQLIKNSSAQITIAVNQLYGKQRLAISGTPIENHMGEFFSLFEFLNPGMTHPALLKTLNAPAENEEPENNLSTQFLKGIRPLILRRLKTDVAKELPDKVEQLLVLPMEENQENLYLSLKTYYQTQLDHQAAEGFYEKSFLLEGLLRLRQVACHPGLLEASSFAHQENANPITHTSNKFEFLLEKLKNLLGANHKAIVFSQFTSLLKLFRPLLDELVIPYEYLDGQSQDRMEIVSRFQNNPEIPILLAGIKSGGLGLNLTAADYCFIFDPWWNPAIEQQAIDRIHRIGQDKTVNIYRLVSQDTVEEKMLLLKDKKQKIADQLLTSDHAFLEQLNYEDFQFLFQ